MHRSRQTSHEDSRAHPYPDGRQVFAGLNRLRLQSRLQPPLRSRSSGRTHGPARPGQRNRLCRRQFERAAERRKSRRRSQVALPSRHEPCHFYAARGMEPLRPAAWWRLLRLLQYPRVSRRFAPARPAESGAPRRVAPGHARARAKPHSSAQRKYDGAAWLTPVSRPASCRGTPGSNPRNSTHRVCPPACG
jgi:hypothetical protein